MEIKPNMMEKAASKSASGHQEDAQSSFHQRMVAVACLTIIPLIYILGKFVVAILH